MIADGLILHTDPRYRLPRWNVYREPKRNHLCVVAARDAQHALKVARQLFILPRTAFAVRER